MSYMLNFIKIFITECIVDSQAVACSLLPSTLIPEHCTLSPYLHSLARSVYRSLHPSQIWSCARGVSYTKLKNSFTSCFPRITDVGRNRAYMCGLCERDSLDFTVSWALTDKLELSHQSFFRRESVHET